MWLKLTILHERDFDTEIYEFENIGIVGRFLEFFKNKKEHYIKNLYETKLHYDICYLLLLTGYDYIPNEKIMKYKDFNIKKLITYSKNEANERHFNKFLIKI